MKGGLAVLLHLAGTVPEPAVDVTWCFYVCEEVDQRFSGLRLLWEQRPDLLRGRRRHAGRADRWQWSRPDARAPCGYGSTSRAPGPTPPGRTPVAMPSTAWPRC